MASNTISILITAKDDATKVLQALGGEMQSTAQKSNGFSQSLGRIRDVALGVYLPQVAAKILDVGKSAINSAGDFEQYRVAFETMLGSADKARKMMQDISDFAKSTPFTLPEVVTASKQLLAFGIAQKDILPTMRKLGDVASGVGVPVGQLSYVFGQVRLAGKMMAQDLMQFTNAGVPMLDYLSQVMHKSAQQIKSDMDKGLAPTFDQVQQALDLMTQKGSKFGGMMDKQSHTFKGVVSNISDATGQALRAFAGIDNNGDIQKGGIFYYLKQGADRAMPALQDMATRIGPNMVQWMQNIKDKFNEFWPAVEKVATRVGDYLGPKLEALWHTIQRDLLPTLLRLWHEVIEPLAPVVGTILVGAFGAVVDILNIFLQTITPVINFMLDNKWIVLGFAGAFGVLYGAMKFNQVFDALTAGFGTLMNVTIPGAMLKVTALQALIATPIGFGAITVAAALIALGAIEQAANNARNAIEGAKRAAESADQSNMQVIQRLQTMTKAPYSPETQARARTTLKGLAGGGAFASGTNFAPGGVSLVGEEGPELVNLPRGSQVIPARQTEKMLGGGVTIHNLNINNNVDINRVVREIGWQLATR